MHNWSPQILLAKCFFYWQQIDTNITMVTYSSVKKLAAGGRGRHGAVGRARRDAPVGDRGEPERPGERHEPQADGGDPCGHLARRQHDVGHEAPAAAEHGEEQQHRHHPHQHAAGRPPALFPLLGWRHRSIFAGGSALRKTQGRRGRTLRRWSRRARGGRRASPVAGVDQIASDPHLVAFLLVDQEQENVPKKVWSVMLFALLWIEECKRSSDGGMAECSSQGGQNGRRGQERMVAI